VFEQCLRVLREVDGLRELVAGDSAPSGVLRLGVPQSIGEVVLLEALRQLAGEYPDLRAQVSSGWGRPSAGAVGERRAGCGRGAVSAEQGIPR
jgi:transcriptional regulator, LysR family